MADDFRNVYNVGPAPLGTIIVGGAIRTGNIEAAGDADIFRIALQAGETYQFDLRGSVGGGGTLTDPELTLQDSAGNDVANNDDGVSLDSRIVYTATVDGFFYLRAFEHGNNATGTYSLQAIELDDFRDAFNDKSAPLGTLPIGGAVRTGSIDTAGDRDIFRVTLQLNETYRFDLRGSDSGGGTLGDPILRLLDSAGGFVAVDDDSGSGSDSQLTFTATVSGVYYLEVGEFSDTVTGTYSLQAVELDDFRDAFDDTSSPLGTVAVGGPVRTGTLDYLRDVDVFRVALQAGETYRFNLGGVDSGGGTLADPLLSLRDSAGVQLVADNNSGPGLDSQLTYTAATGGFFYLVVSEPGNDAAGSYTLKAVELDDFRDAFDDPTAPLGVVAVGGADRTGSIENDGDRDVIRVTLQAGERYQFDLFGVDGGGGTLSDPQLRLRDAVGAEVAFDDDAGVGLDSQIVFTANASGNHYLDVGDFADNEAGTYTLRAVELDDFRDAFNDATAPLGVIAAGQLKTGSIETADDADVFRISLQGNVAYRFNLRGADSSGGTLGDPFLRLLNSAGGEVASNDDNGTNLDSRIDFTPTVSGIYYLEANALSSVALGTYTMEAALI